MNFTTATKIGDLVLEWPGAMRVLEGLNVDYCCGGHRSLAEACGLAGLDPDEVLGRLEAVQADRPGPADPKAWQEAALTDLMAHLEATHHVFTREELARVAPLMARVLQVHGDRHPELARTSACFLAMAADLEPHLLKEEEILFPFIRGLEAGEGSGACFGSVASPVQVMQAEHEAVGDLLRELRILTRDYTAPEDACGSYRSLLMGLKSLEEDLHRHIYLESHLLFPRAVALEAAGVTGPRQTIAIV
jgi:regulator of cell morphogenesis and NO signaling